MKIIETSRRRFLQTGIALCIYSTTSFTKPLQFKEMKNQKVPYLCNMCRNKCAGFARVENSKVVKLDPNPYFPKSRNMLCPKGNAGIDALYDSDRLKYPLIRIGERGDGRYKKVTWDEANEYIKNKLIKILDEQKDNRSTIAYCNGEGFNKDEYIKFFGGKVGSTNFLDEGSICLNTKLGAEVLTLGDTTQPDIQNSDYLIISGANRYESLITPDSVDMLHSKQKVVVLDPRVTVTAQKADTYLPLHPGTDLAFCLALIYIAIKDELYDKEYVKKYFKDFDRLKKETLQNRYTPQWASTKTNIKKEKIDIVAKEFFSAKRPLYYLGRRSVWSDNDFQLRRAMILINALAGSINTKGGLIFGQPIKIEQEEIVEPFYNNAQGRFDLDGIVYGSSKGGSWLNFRDKVVNKTAPYPIKAMFIRKHNLMQNMPNILKTKKMLEMMDLVVVLDTMPSDTTLMADVILPECTYLEREDLVVSFNRTEPSLALRNQVIEPLYESRSMQDILKHLGKKLSKPLFELSKKYDEELQDNISDIGEKKAFTEGGYDLSELYKNDIATRNKNLILKQFGKDVYKSLKEKGVWYKHMADHRLLENNYYSYYDENHKFYTIDKKYHIHCSLKKLQKNGFDAIPCWRDSYDFKVAKDSFRIITGRYITSTQTASSNNAMLKDMKHDNCVWINNIVAKKLGITKDDKVVITSNIARVVIKAYPTNKIHPQVVWFAHGFGMHSEELSNAYGIGASDNILIEDKFEKIYGCATMHHSDVTIRKI